MTVYFSFLFHIYQPPVQLPSIVKKVTVESYRPIIKTLQEFPESKIDLNINASLTEQLDEYELNDVIEGFAELGRNGQVEFTGSAKYHAILPLIPEPEIIRQIALNEETNQYHFGNVYDPKGFFPPEMAVDPAIFEAIKTTGHDWFIMSGIGNTNPIFPSESFHATENGLNIVFRDDVISNDISFDKLSGVNFFDRIDYRDTTEDYYIIIAQDGETYGHHMEHAFDHFFKPMLRKLKYEDNFEMVHIGELLEIFPTDEIMTPLASSWSTNEGDLHHGVAFPLWYHPDNELHKLQHKIIMKVTSLVLNAEMHKENGDSEKYWETARTMLDRGSHSCQQWWASKRPWYSPDMILRGLHELMLSAVNARRSLPVKKENKDIIDGFTAVLDDILDLEKQIVLKLK